MATADNGGGAGGKFRKKPTRRTNSTPYDRPATALRPTQVVGAALRDENRNNSWISKLVDPASRLITSGAHRLFSSVFRKRLLPPPQPQPQPQLQPQPKPSDEAPGIRDAQRESTVMVSPSGSKEANVSGSMSLSGGVAELEDILKQKTFTRSEIDHLTALLMSRTVDGLVEAEKGTSERKFPSEKAIHSRHELVTNLPSLENRVEHAAISTPVVRSKVVDDVVASPVDLAKAYMGSRPTRASPSVLGLQNEMSRENLFATYNLTSKPKSSSMSLIQRPSSDIGASDNGFMTPRFRGRSAIYSMARTPYSRLHPAKVYKAAETASDVCGASSSSHNATEMQQFSGSNRQVLKRRSSVLESDIGFVGPIRRIRQKPNLLHHKTLSVPASGSVHLKHGSENSTDASELPPSINWSSHHRSSTKALADNGMPSTSNGYVPSKSIETAEKIFQHLDSLTQKGKSPEKKIDIMDGSSSEKKIPGIQDGFSLKSRSNTESLKVLETSEGSRKGNGLLDPKNVHDCSPKVSASVEVGVKDIFAPSVEGGLENGSSKNGLDNMIERPIFGQQQKKRGFQISALEDYLELDDDGLTNDAASTPNIKVANSNDIAKNSYAISDNSPQNAANSDANPPAPNANLTNNLLAAKKESSLPNISSVSQKISGFPSSFVPLSSSGTSMTNTQAAVSSPPLVAEMDKAATPSEKVNEINPNNSDSAKSAPFSYSPSFSTWEPAVPTDTKTKLLHSESNAVTKVNEPGKADKKRALLFADASKKIEDTPSAPSTTKGFLTFGSPSSNATLSNGLSSSNGGISPARTLSGANDQAPNPVSFPVFSFSNGNAVSTTTTTVASSTGPVISSSLTGNNATLASSSGSQVSTSIAAPTVSFGSTFQFGSSAIVSTSTVGTSAPEPTTKTEAEINENRFGKFTNIPFTAKPPGTAAVGSDNSEVTAASAIKTGGNETPVVATSAFPAAPIFGLQASSSPSAIGASISTQAPSSQSASSASSSMFGLSVPTGFDASKVGNPFAPQVSISASSTSGTSTMTTPISSSSNSTTPGVFGWQSPKPAVPFGTSSQSPVFAFGSSTSGTSSAANNNSTIPTAFGASSNTSSGSAPFVFGSTSSSVFSIPSTVASNPAALSTAFPSQSTFGISTAQPFAFGSAPLGGSNDQMSMEDSMAEDSVQVPAPAAPVFGAPLPGPSSFVFGGAPTPTLTPTPTQTPPMGSTFQFGGQQTQVSQNSPFQLSGSFEHNAGGAGGFSVGSGGGDKSNRRIVKVKNRMRKK